MQSNDPCLSFLNNKNSNCGQYIEMDMNKNKRMRIENPTPPRTPQNMDPSIENSNQLNTQIHNQMNTQIPHHLNQQIQQMNHILGTPDHSNLDIIFANDPSMFKPVYPFSFSSNSILPCINENQWGSSADHAFKKNAPTPCLFVSYWDEQKTNVLQLEQNGQLISKRLDNEMINGTKLLNLTGVTRGKRDSLLKQETARHVIKTGAMHLKGVWLPIKRAFKLAKDYGVLHILAPLFERSGPVPNGPSSNGCSNVSSRVSSNVPPNDRSNGPSNAVSTKFQQENTKLNKIDSELYNISLWNNTLNGSHDETNDELKNLLLEQWTEDLDWSKDCKPLFKGSSTNGNELYDYNIKQQQDFDIESLLNKLPSRK